MRAANALLSIEVNGSSQLALPKQVQRDPLKHTIEHVDLVIVRRGEKVTVDVPCISRGRRSGDAGRGGPQQHPDRGRGHHIPQRIIVSVEGLPPGTQILARDLQLPAGSTVDLDPETLIVNITNAPTAEALEAELAEAEAEAGIEPTVAATTEPTTDEALPESESA